MLINPASAITQLPEKKPMLADEGTARIPLSLFPSGVKPGDRVSVTITGVDSVAGTVTVVADKPTEAVPSAPTEPEMNIATEPLDSVKSYLYKKTMEKES